MKSFVTLIILLITFSVNINFAVACTIFTVKSGDKVLVGNNEDFWYSVKAEMWFVPANGKSYGRVLFGWDNFAQGGMNEKGLFFDAADAGDPLAPQYKEKTPENGKSDKPNFKGNIGEEILEKCATTEEAMQILNKYNFPNLTNGHLLFADSRGDSFVAEWVRGELKIIKKEGNYQIITNYLLSEPPIDKDLLLRQNEVIKMLNQNVEITGGYIASILKHVAQYGENEGKIGGTIYSNIYSLDKRELVVFYKRDFTKPVQINLAAELAKGKSRFNLEKLFNPK